MDNQNIPAGQTSSPVSPQTVPQNTIPSAPSQTVSQGNIPPAPPQMASGGKVPPAAPQTASQGKFPPIPPQNIPQANTSPVSPQTAPLSKLPPMSPQNIPQSNTSRVPSQMASPETAPEGNVPPAALRQTPQMNVSPRQLVAQPVQPSSEQPQPQTQQQPNTPAQPQASQTPPVFSQPQSQTLPEREGGTLDIPQRHSSRQMQEPETKSPKSKRKRLRTFPIFLFLLLIGTVALLVHLYKGAKQEIADREADIKELETQLDDESARADAADADLEEYIEKVKTFGAKDSVNLTFMRHMFPDMVVLPAEGGFAYYPINKDLRMAEYDYSALKTSSSGVKSYVPDNIRASYAGIDVSTFQGDIAWKKVADDNIDYAMIRLGYRGYGNGTLVLDDTYKKNIKGATKNGLDVGVYFFTQAVNAKEAKEEAEFVLKHIKGYKVNYPVVIDTEMIESGKSRGNALTPEERTETIKVFCDTIKEAGYTPMVYANLTWFITALDVSQLEDYEKWFAGYEAEPSYPYAFSMWQYTSSGTVKGVKGAVDRNISFVNYAEK